jgi:methionyl-tRNA formyltransferase
MRILVCSQRDLLSCLALNALLPGLEGKPVAVALQKVEPVDVHSGNDLDLMRWFDRNLPLDQWFPSLDQCREPPGELLTFHHLARRHGISFHAIDQINDGDGFELVEAFDPDLILSLRFGLIFKKHVIARPRLGVLNIHPGALPEYAGLYAPMRGMLAGERKLTSTLHMVDHGVDSGPVVDSRDLITDARSLYWHFLQLYRLGVDAFLRLLPDLDEGGLLATRPQDANRRRYFSEPSQRDLEAFQRRGFRLVDRHDHQTLIAGFGNLTSAQAASSAS